ncbi:MAG: hypothetical protein AB1405_10730 [Bdellovibrionota bacterium]
MSAKWKFKDPGWIAALALLLGAVACGDNGGGINLGTLSEALFTDTDLRNGIGAGCEGGGGCDGDIADPEAWGVTVSAVASDESYTLTVDGVDYEIVSDLSATLDEIETALIDCINNGGASCEGGEPASGSSTAVATQGSVIVSANTPWGDINVTEIDDRLDSPVLATTQDLEGFLGLFQAIGGFQPSADDLIDCAQGTTPVGWPADECEDNDFLALPDSGSRRVTLIASQETDCGDSAADGTLFVTTTHTVFVTAAGEVDDTENIDETSIFRFTNCLLTGNIGIAGGTIGTTLFLNGAITYLRHEPGEETDENPFRLRMTGRATLETDLDGAGAGTEGFWSDSMDMNVALTDGETFLDINGGLCFGAAVDFGGAANTDTDDECATGGDHFAPATAVICTLFGC